MNCSKSLAALFCAAVLAGCGDDDDPPIREGACARAKSVAEAVELYGAGWNERDGARRDCLFARSVSPDLVYVDPTIDTTTADGLSAAIADFQTNAPGASIVQLSGLDERDGELRFTWDFRLTDPATQVTQSAVKGVDYMEIGEDGLITNIRGYWEPLPPGPPDGMLAEYVTAWEASLPDASRAEILSRVLGADPHFTADGIDALGALAISDAMSEAAVTQIQVLGVQRYPKFARIALELEGNAVTDYLYLDEQGRITRAARFKGDFPPL
ncbi:MAG TPA: hypothetical protein VI072_27160 [Polyangiaceae bacterium]